MLPPKKTGGIADKRGMFKYILEEWSPYSDEKTGLDLKKLPVGVYVPKGYNGVKPFGLLVFISWDYPDAEYRKILDKNSLIWVGYNCYNINYVPFTKEHKHEVFSLAMVYNMLKYYNIDSARIYIAGSSWGGRLTGKIIHRRPDIFKGGIASCGCQSDNWDDEIKGFLPNLNYAQKNTSLVITAGDYDFNRPEAFYMYDYFLMRNFHNIFYIQDANRYHGGLSGPNFEKAIDLLDTNRINAAYLYSP